MPMRITLFELRRIIREVLTEESWPNGRVLPNSEPMDPDEFALMATGGLGRRDRGVDELEETEVANTNE